MREVKLNVNGQDFPIHYQMLSMIAENMPDGKSYAPLVQALLGLDIPSITVSLIDNDTLTTTDLDRIWEKGDLDARRKLMDTATFRKNLTDAQAEEILRLNDSEMLETLARYVEELYPHENDKQAMRLSGKMADKLLESMANHPDFSVRKQLERNAQAPAKFKPTLAEMAKHGSLYWGSDISGLTMQDLEALKEIPLDSLKNIARNIEDIEDKGARAAVADWLCSSKDPAVRLELAENRRAPQAILRRLAEDADLDVANAARENLEDE